MDTCQYCQKIIKDNEEIKTFHFQKKKPCHLKCYKNKKKKLVLLKVLNALFLSGYVYGESKISSRAEWKATPGGVCPYCQKIIKDNEEIKIFHSQKKKQCHLECYKKRPHRSWWEWLIAITVMSVGLCITLLFIFLH